MRLTMATFLAGLISLSLSAFSIASELKTSIGVLTVEAQTSPQKKGRAVMNASKKCKNTNLDRSKCMIELILEDIAKTYPHPGGGGISSLNAVSSTAYAISLPQEERIDIFTYEFDVKPGSVSIKSKIQSTQSFEPKSPTNSPSKK
jgi:hypothetical protein